MSISFKGISKRYTAPVLADFSAELPECGLVLLTGPSGCGKTTLLRILLGLSSADSGEVCGTEGLRFSVVFQEDRLFESFTIADNLNAPLAKKLASEQLDALLSSLGLEGVAGQYPNELSGGMRRRAAIARALAFDGDVFVLDEPFTGLDEYARQLVIDQLLRRREEKLILLVTHDPLPLKEYASQIIALSPLVPTGSI